MPKRIQRKRVKGWRMPAGAVYVGRPTWWGNPYKVIAQHRSGPFDVEIDGVFLGQSTGIGGAREIATRRFRNAVEHGRGNVACPEEIRAELRGKDLMCWCPLDQPCHADVLLQIANSAVTS